jgi:predicted RNA-binding Zn-ribbon protein involved in translation (DUF1610 family)
LVSYVCPECGHREVIGLEVRVSVGGPLEQRKCPNCGEEMNRE